VFLASSVIAALRNNQTLKISGLNLVICPIESCTTTPDTCEKGRNATCEKKIDVIYEHNGHNKLVFLRFYYQLKNYDREGFIGTTDRALNVLLKRDIIHRANLVEN
jgi:hypothetical protein